MEENNLPNADFDSVATAVYQAIDNSPSQRMDFESQNAILEPREVNEDDDEAYDEDAISHETDECTKSTITGDYHNLPLDRHSNKSDNIDDHAVDEAEAAPEVEPSEKKVNCVLAVRHHRMSQDDEDDGLDTESLEHLRFEEDGDDAGDQNDLTQQPKIAIAGDNRPDPIIFHDKDGLITKITISNTKTTPTIEKLETPLTTKVVKEKASDESASPDEKLPKQDRSSTPYSREYIALQKSVNESKVLTEFVTDASVVKTRKLRTKEPIAPGVIPASTPASTDHSYSSKRWRTNPDSPDIDAAIRIMNKKRQHKKRYVPLKEEAALNNTTISTVTDKHLARSSRSKSMLYNNFSDNSNSSTNSKHKKRSRSMQKYDSDCSTHSALNNWPSDENVNVAGSGSFKRTNMRSENSEFVQKQKDFLKQVINSTQDTPHRRSRSRSRGEDSVGSNSNKQKTPRSKERVSKRFRGEVEPGEDDQPLSQSVTSVASSTINEPFDDTSPNTSNNSVGTANTSGEVDNHTVNLELYIKKVYHPPPKSGSDSFCWKCHESKVNLPCSRCIRSYHASCAKVKVDTMWICPECTTLDNVLNSPKRSRRNELPLDLLSQLLSFALKRMRYARGHYSFHMPYEEGTAYKRIILNPVSFDTLQAKVEAKEYRCADEFVNDTKWMLHNANILSSGNSTKTVSATKAILKICRQEATEIETCAECYLNANTRTDWFVDVCSQPHLLLWAKLKGFPFWPAKAMGFGQHSLVNVKFFGEHDRAFVPIKDCYLYSVQDPNTQTGKRAAKELADCIKEVGEHIERIISKVGGFSYAPYKTLYDPTDEMRQLENMMPGVQEFIKRQHGMTSKPSLQFKIYKTADNHLSIRQKDASTGEISSIHQQQQQQQQQQDDDLVGGSLKKKKGITPPPALTVEKNMENVPVSAAKYEVISKVTSDDSNSSKLSPVILKRKSINGSEVKKVQEDECHELSLPKLARIEDKLAEDNCNNHTLKRKVDIGCAEKPKAKHSKPQELRIPIMAIKTISVNKEVNMLSHDANRSSKEGPSAVINLQTAQPVNAVASQKVVESLVKNKQGVTIKKLAKAMPPTTTTNVSSVASVLHTTTQPKIISTGTNNTKGDLTNPSPKTVEKQTRTSVVKEKTDEQKQREEQNVNNILKGLIPFVEVKKEILSDKEEEEHNEMTTTTIINSKPIDKTTANAQIVATPETCSPKETPPISKTNLSNENTNENLLLHVKEEVFSDEGEIDANVPLLPEFSKINSAQAVKSVNTKSANDVRLVGDTIIQKLSNKNTTSQQNNTSSANTNKRCTLKGIPYGPLPASAVHKTCMQSLHNDAAGIIPRAKKSFPQHSPPMDKLTPTSVNNSSGASSFTVTSTGAIGLANPNVEGNKRPLSRTTMVAIPVDFGGTAQTSNSMATMISSIPVPPLTAVSKISSSSNAYNSMAHNAPATVTVSGTSGSLTTPSVVSLNSTTLATTPISSLTSLTSMSLSSSGKSPISSSLTSTSLSSSTLSVAARKSPISVVTFNNKSAAPTPSTIVTQNSKNVLTMSTPPPLAGLSGSTLSPSTSVNVTTTTETCATSTTVATITNTTGSQTESRAVTDNKNRGPPKLFSKPRGYLESEGNPMYTLEAGPVSKIFIENGHKMADYFISVMEDTMSEIAQGSEDSLRAKVVLLDLELERTKVHHAAEIERTKVQHTAEIERTKDFYLQQMAEIRQTSEQMRNSMEKERIRVVNEIRKQCNAEKIRAVEETKRKQWCAQCRREANFYCCWNTSYCDYPCQQLHWAKHASNCTQTRTCGMESSTSNVSTQNFHGSSTTHEQRHQSKSTTSHSTINSPANYNTKSSISSLSMTQTKKEKTIIKSSSSTNMMAPASGTTSSTLSAARSNTTPSAEVLKLPTNTYLRPVTSTPLNAQALRCNTTYSIPVQRFNVPLPMTTHTNTSGRHTFTIVRQGNGWSGPVHMANTATSSTIAAPIVSVPPQGSTHRSGGPVLAANKNTKTQIRYH